MRTFHSCPGLWPRRRVFVCWACPIHEAPRKEPVGSGRWQNKGVVGVGIRARGAPWKWGAGARIGPFPGAKRCDTRRGAQRKERDVGKSCRNPRRGGRQRHTSLGIGRDHTVSLQWVGADETKRKVSLPGQPTP